LQRFETVAIDETKKQNFQSVLQRFETAANYVNLKKKIALWQFRTAAKYEF
jgi:hypothetical protein